MAPIVRKALKIAGVVVGGLVLLLIVFAVLNSWPFPLWRLAFENPKLYGNWDRGEAWHFEVRVTNNGDFGVAKINVRIDILNQSGAQIDGREVMLDGTVPAHSTRLLSSPWLGITRLPTAGQWTWNYRVLGAKYAWFWSSE